MKECKKRGKRPIQKEIADKIAWYAKCYGMSIKAEEIQTQLFKEFGDTIGLTTINSYRRRALKKADFNTATDQENQYPRLTDDEFVKAVQLYQKLKKLGLIW